MPQPLIERYRDRLPLEQGDPVVSLNEGSTPLIPAERLSERVGARVFLKFEGANPTGVVQGPGDDRGCIAGQGPGRGGGDLRLHGNTAASAAAYAAKGRDARAR